MKIFEGDFDSIENVIREFDIQEDDVKDIEILYANYQLGSYEGEALVVFKKNGKLYEVVGSHCSCYGLEGQWRPELTNKEALLRCHKYFFDSSDTSFNSFVEALENE